MTAAAIETAGLTKAFSGKTVLNDVNLSLYPGEVFGIIGENGAGRSTVRKKRETRIAERRTARVRPESPHFMSWGVRIAAPRQPFTPLSTVRSRHQ